MRPRNSICQLLIVVAFFAIGFAALGNPTEFWAWCSFAIALAIVGFACLEVLLSRGSDRRRFVAMAVCGGGYLMLTFNPWFSTEVSPYLATTWIIDHLPQPNPGILECPDDNTSVPGAGLQTYSVSGFQRWNYVATVVPATDTRQQIGHSIFAIVFACLGGLAARLITVARSEPRIQTDHQIYTFDQIEKLVGQQASNDG